MRHPLCPSCGADPRLNTTRCWLCRHPLPEGPAPEPAPDFVPPPPLYQAAEDRAELDVTSIVILIGLIAATIGAVGVSGPVRNALGGVSLLPLFYLLYWLTSDRGGSQEPLGGVRKFLRGLFLIACVIVLVPVAVVVALAAVCAAVAFGFSFAGS